MRKCLLPLLFVVGCGGSGGGGDTGSNPFAGNYSGHANVNFVNTGDAFVRIPKTGPAGFRMNDSRGFTEDWITFIKPDGSYIGNYLGQGSAEEIHGDVKLDGNILVVTVKFRYRNLDAVILAKRD